MAVSDRNKDIERRYSQQCPSESGRSSASRSSRPGVPRSQHAPAKMAKKRTAVRLLRPGKMPKVYTKKRKPKRTLSPALVFAAAIFTALLMFMIVSFVQINEYTIQVSTLQGEVNSYNKQAEELSIKLEEKNSLTSIEEYSKEKLGMVSGDRLKKEYISSENGDKIETYDLSEVETGPISSTLSAFFSNFRGFFGYFED